MTYYYAIEYRNPAVVQALRFDTNEHRAAYIAKRITSIDDIGVVMLVAALEGDLLDFINNVGWEPRYFIAQPHDEHIRHDGYYLSDTHASQV